MSQMAAQLAVRNARWRAGRVVAITIGRGNSRLGRDRAAGAIHRIPENHLDRADPCCSRAIHRAGLPYEREPIHSTHAERVALRVYDDIRRMEALVHESGLGWTIVRPSGLFDLPQTTNYVAGETDPIGAFTARIDLADHLVKLAQDGTARRKTVVVSTTEHAPTVWEMIRREACKSDAQLAPSV
jgi:uncharacterized protein YbjT (DUF2867 family)